MIVMQRFMWLVYHRATILPDSKGRLKYHTIIWDWNGTLLRDALLCRSVMNSLLAERQLKTMSRQRYERLFDFPVTSYYASLGFDFSRESFEALGNAFMRGYEDQRHRCNLQPGARRMLHHFHAHGIQQVILSAYRQDSLESLLDAKNVSRYFSLIVGADDHYARGKAEQAQRLIGQCSAHPSRIIMIGDTRHDADVARAMGVDCALVYGGHQSMERLLETGNRVFGSLDEVNQWLTEET
jgi:phosphoglycolate phosphatase